MENALEEGLKGVTSTTGLTGGDAVLLQEYIKSGKSLAGPTLLDAVSKAVATNEVNAAMGKNLCNAYCRFCGSCTRCIIWFKTSSRT